MVRSSSSSSRTSWTSTPFVVLLLLLLGGTSGSAASGIDNTNPLTQQKSGDPTIDALIEWIRSKPNGYFNSDKIEWRPWKGDNDDDDNDDSPTSSSSFAMFATKDVKKDETLIVIPYSALFTSRGDKTNGSICATTTKLIHEQQRGIDSDYYPYIRFLFGDINDETTTTIARKRTELPCEWSTAGQHLLNKILGKDLLLQRATIIHDYKAKCSKFTPPANQITPLMNDAYRMVIARSWNEVMIPVYDLFNHRNGKWTNVDATSAHILGQDVRVYATRNIKMGEQLYNSYNECSDVDCEGIQYTYGTQHILADYGFVESYPRRWIIRTDGYTGEDDYVLEIDTMTALVKDEADKDGSKGPSHQRRIAYWPLGDRPSSIDALNWIRAQWKRLQDLDVIIEEGVKTLESSHEREMILEYFRGYKEALELAWTHRGDGSKTDGDDATADDEDPAYDSLTSPKGLAVEGSNTFVCLHNPTNRDYHTYVETKSQYQEIAFTYNKDTDNTCLQLSGWLQTCTDFRPHYHEAFVHVPAQYIQGDVKRVAFLGGGDNMILHEILKYPQLELVVGMELDQQVIRSSFQHLGTLPYFDDHRVQWWFGDATKSLLALPEDYFGSFDLVLVDLQTFVADALKVTDRLTIMDTAILLMKQDGGVIAKNEDFPVRTNVGFAKYTVDLEYHDLPHICQQSITMGSNSIDFVTATPKIHDGVEVMAIEFAGTPSSSASSSSNPFHAWYGYRQSIPDACESFQKDAKKSESAAPSQGNDQIGVLVIVEAENVGLPLDDIAIVQAVISKAIEDMGLSEVSISSDSEFDDKVFVIVLKEGYISVREFADKKYIAFDLHLWDSLDAVDAIKNGLVSAVGGNIKESTTSFRFVTGGMHGLESCRKDILSQIALDAKESLCNTTDGTSQEAIATAAESEAMSIMFQTLISSLTANKDHVSIAVLCGDESTECSSLEAVKKLDTSSKASVIPIYACSSLDDMTTCEKEIQEKFETAVFAAEPRMKKMDVLVLDASLPFAMGQIVEKIFRNKATFGSLVDASHVVLSPVPTGQVWRTVLLDRFRTDMAIFDPAHRADVRFYHPNNNNNDDPQEDPRSYIEWCIFASRDGSFFNHLSLAISTVQQETGWTPQVLEVANGIISLIAEMNVTKTFRDSDYDKTRATSQWKTQRPVGHQTIYQFALQPPKTPLKVGERVLAEHRPGPWDVLYGGAVVQEVLNDDDDEEGGGGYSVLYDGDTEPETIRRDQIRKYSIADLDMTLAFEVGDLIFYKNEDGLYQNGVVAQREEVVPANDGISSQYYYAINLLNTEGKKLYGISRNKLLYQYESSDFVQTVPPLDVPELMGALGYALDQTFGPHQVMSPMSTVTVGSGVVIASFWTAGHAILKWDGKDRVDINLFTYNEDIPSRLEFQQLFTNELDFVNGIARDEHPRGYGRVVNFASEIAHPSQWIEKQERQPMEQEES